MTFSNDAEAVGLTAMRSAWQALTIEWDLTQRERQDLLPQGGEFANPMPSDTAARMALIVEIGYRLRFDTTAELREWLRRPVLMFALDAPLDVMAGSMDDLVRIRALVERGFGS